MKFYLWKIVQVNREQEIYIGCIQYTKEFLYKDHEYNESMKSYKLEGPWSRA